MTFSELFKKARKKVQISQKIFADELKCSQSFIAAIEKNQRNPSYEMIVKFKSYCKKIKMKYDFNKCFDE